MPVPLDIEDPEQLIAYLRRSGRIGPAETPRVTRLSGGVSNRTVLVERAGGEAWVLKQALAKLRVAVDWFSDPARIGREAAGLRWLSRLAPAGAITPLVFEDPAEHLLAMRAVPRPHENWKTMLLAGEVEAEHVAQFARLLASIHRGAAGRADVRDAFADASFFESLRLEPYYLYTAEQVPAAADFLRGLVDATRGRRLTLVHGDYSPKNILVYHGRLVLLDHEVIHWGDPAFDLGFSLTHLLSKAHHLPIHRAAFAEAARQCWQEYRQAVGDLTRAPLTPTLSPHPRQHPQKGGEGAELPWSADLEPFAVRHTLACLLARVAGRSPLEYLTEAERGRQRAATVSLISSPPARVDDLIASFIERLT